MRPAHSRVIEAERAHELRRAFERQMPLQMLDTKTPARYAKTNRHFLVLPSFQLYFVWLN